MDKDTSQALVILAVADTKDAAKALLTAVLPNSTPENNILNGNQDGLNIRGYIKCPGLETFGINFNGYTDMVLVSVTDNKFLEEISNYVVTRTDAPCRLLVDDTDRSTDAVTMGAEWSSKVGVADHFTNQVKRVAKFNGIWKENGGDTYIKNKGVGALWKSFRLESR